MRTQVAIIGAGPAGLLLSQLLHLQGIESTVLECRDRAYVEGRVRAGVLEHGTVQTLREAEVGRRLDAEGLPHAGTELRFAGSGHRIDFTELTGRHITVYGQQEVVKDLIAKRLADKADLRFEVAELAITGLDTDAPTVRFDQAGERAELRPDFVIGADGFHGRCRELIPDLTSYQHDYPYAWLGILAEAAPSSAELIYARHERGFALHSMRSPTITRLYLQVRPDAELADWPDELIWAELRVRLADQNGFSLAEGPL
ncbi:MAG: 4-hydroxybenzoate 3-monooxygenase, partial [Jatrophihabitantaceae bacterium]